MNPTSIFWDDVTFKDQTILNDQMSQPNFLRLQIEVQETALKDVEALYDLVDSYTQFNQFQIALLHGEYAAEKGLDPWKEHYLYCLLGHCSLALGLGEGIKWATKAIAINDEYADPYLILGQYAQATKRYGVAEAWYKRALLCTSPTSWKFWKDSNVDRAIKPFEALAILYKETNKLDLAIEYHNKAKKAGGKHIPWILENDKLFIKEDKENKDKE
jgi:exonuclease V gamma subunit